MQGKLPNKTRIFIPTEPLKSLEKKGKTVRKTRNSSQQRKNKEFQKNKDQKVRVTVKKKEYTALLQCRTFFLCRKEWGPQRKDFGGRYGFPGFQRALYPPPVWKVFLEARKVPQKIFFQWWSCTLFSSLCKSRALISFIRLNDKCHLAPPPKARQVHQPKGLRRTYYGKDSELLRPLIGGFGAEAFNRFQSP